jgi:cell division protein FtsB
MSLKLKNILFKSKYPLTLIVFGVLIGFVGESSLVNRCSQKAEINRLETEIDSLNSRFEKDKKTLQQLNDNPEVIKEIAREKDFMSSKDEDVFVIYDEEIENYEQGKDL